MTHHDILKEVHKFYPVGLPCSNEGYPGYQQLRNSIATRVNQLICEKPWEPWDTFANKVISKYPDNKIHSATYLQFPNLLLTIEIFKKKPGANCRDEESDYLSILYCAMVYNIF